MTAHAYLVGSDVIGADTTIGLEVPVSSTQKVLVSVGIFAGVLLGGAILLREFARAMSVR
jgi:hypothetical protein